MAAQRKYPEELRHRAVRLVLDAKTGGRRSACVRIGGQLGTEQLSRLGTAMTRTVTACAPDLLDRPGVGYDSAAALLIAVGDNPERMKNEASFAALCGVSPVEFSSGKTTKRRLNRGGNRQANAALYRIVLTRLRWHETNQDYLHNRTKKGKSKRDVIRCLKRYLAREIFAILKTLPDQHKNPEQPELTT